MPPDRYDVLARALIEMGQRVLGQTYDVAELANAQKDTPVPVATLKELEDARADLERANREIAELRENLATLQRAAVALDERIDSIKLQPVAA